MDRVRAINPFSPDHRAVKKLPIFVHFSGQRIELMEEVLTNILSWGDDLASMSILSDS
jgi:hypothetical protein